MKYCKDCLYIERHIGGAECTHPSARTESEDPVNGKSVSQSKCSSHRREYGGGCGPLARHFAQR